MKRVRNSPTSRRARRTVAATLLALAGAGLAGCQPVPDWPAFHRDAARSGVSTTLPAPGRLGVAAARLDGAVYAAPVVAAGTLVVATENDSVYGLDPATLRVRWARHLATPVPRSHLPCGDIDPLGITGTPVYDAASGRVFVVTESETARGVVHTLVGLSVTDGSLRLVRAVTPPVGTPRDHQQRAALALVDGIVIVAFGGLAGDCGDYHGSLAAVNANGRGTTLHYTLPTTREGGIWATGGPVVDRAGNVYVSVGNGQAGEVGPHRNAPYDLSDSVLELRPGLQRVGFFAPTRWRDDNASDLDLGSSSPSLTATGYILATGKSQVGYVLRAGRLGGIGAQVGAPVTGLCGGGGAFGASAVNGDAVYLPCNDGVLAVRVTSAGAVQRVWKAPGGVDGSPVVGGGAVWSLDPGAGVLHVLAAGDGHQLAAVTVGASSRFATPALYGGRVYVGTLSGVAAVSGA